MDNLNRRIIYFTKYTIEGPSSRYRTFQYLPYLNERFDTKVIPFFDKKYLDAFQSGLTYSKINLVVKILQRFYQILVKIRKSDLLVIEYELIPYFLPVLEYILKLRKIKYILDFDDAIFHNYDMSNNTLVKTLLKNKIPTIIKWASHVVTGSPYLTDFALKFNSNVSEIPTSVSKKLYQPVIREHQNEILKIGWVGSKTTSINIITILPALLQISEKINFELLLIGFDKKLESKLAGIDYEIINWSKNDEINQIRKFDVGIMPLTDTPLNNGKCGFKLVQYMACALPTISTPLIANKKINRNGLNLHADSTDEWMAAFENVYNNKNHFYNVGLKNYDDFLKYYCTEENKNIYMDLYDNIINN